MAWQKLSFETCQLERSNFLETSLTGLDFSTATFSSLNFTAAKSRGLIISPLQALTIVQLLGFQLKED